MAGKNKIALLLLISIMLITAIFTFRSLDIDQHDLISGYENE